MKKNLLKRIAALTLAAALCSTALLSGTLAKYVSSVEGSGSATIATFDYDVLAGGTNVSADMKSIMMEDELDLFAQRNTDDAGVYVDPTLTEAPIIAPGTQGYFYIRTNNTSEVLVDDTFEFEEINNQYGTATGQVDVNVPLVYEFDGKYYSNFFAINYTADIYMNQAVPVGPYLATIVGDLEDMATAVSAKVQNIDYIDGTADYMIKWYWPFGDNANRIPDDTELGEFATEADANAYDRTVTFGIKATIEQVDDK